MRGVTVRIGFVPTIRFSFTQWCRKMHDDSLQMLHQLPNVEIIEANEGELNAATGTLPNAVVNTMDEGEALADYFRMKKVDAIVIAALDFGDERSAVKVAELLRVPILLFATKEPPAVQDASMARQSDSYCGTLSLASGLYRRKLTFHYAGIFMPDEAALLSELETFARAVAVVKGMMGARIGQVGVRPGPFETVGYDEVAMIQKFGQNVYYTELSEITGRAMALKSDHPAVVATMAEVRAEVPSITVSDEYLLNSARLEVAMTEFFEHNRLSALTMQCWPSVQKLTGVSTCALYGRMTGKAMLTACETDMLGALSMLVSYQAALGETLPHFVDWTIQHRENPNQLLAWHCGNAPVSLAKDPKAVALRSRGDMQGSEPIDPTDTQEGLYQFQIKPGKITFCRLAEYDNEWKMLIATGDIVPSEETLAGTWAWVEVKDHAKLYRTLIEEGFIHHASMIHGDQREALKLACKFMDITPVVVD